MSNEAEIAARIRALLPREARWAYYQKGNGPMFIYNTERVRTFYGGLADGKFESAVFVPYGPGSRSGKAKTWRVVESSRSLHDLRKDAKARALRLFQEWEKTGKT